MSSSAIPCCIVFIVVKVVDDVKGLFEFEVEEALLYGQSIAAAALCVLFTFFYFLRVPAVDLSVVGSAFGVEETLVFEVSSGAVALCRGFLGVGFNAVIVLTRGGGEDDSMLSLKSSMPSMSTSFEVRLSSTSPALSLLCPSIAMVISSGGK